MKRLSFVAALALVLTAAIPSAALAADHRAAASLRPLAQVTVNANDPVPIVTLGWSVNAAQGRTRVFGEVRNDFPLPIGRVVLRVRLLDASNQVLMTGPGYTYLDVLNPGDKSPFEADFEFSAEPANADVEVVDWTPEFSPANHNFNVAVSSEAYDPDGTFHIGVAVQNNNTTTAEDVFLGFTFIAADGTTADAGGLTLSDPISAQKTNVVVISGGPIAQHSQIHLVAESPTAPSLPIVLVQPTASPKVGTKIMLHGTASPGDTISLQDWQSGQFATVPGATAKADSSGDFAIAYLVKDTNIVRAVGSGSAISVPVVIVATPAVTLKASKTTVVHGKPVVLTGAVLPSFPGTYVTIQRKVGSKWVTVAKVALNSASKFTYKWTPKTKGTYVLSVLMPETDLLFSGRSNTVKVIVT